MEKISLKTRMMTFIVCLLVLTSFSVTVLADSYLYDKNGNMIQEQTAAGNKCYIYNSANQLVKVTDCAASPKTIAEYAYDQTGRRIRTIEYLSSGTVTTYYPFDDYETVVGGSTPGNTVYYFANGERVARKDPDSTVHYYHGDHLGSTSMITSSSGVMEENNKYYPFGAVRSGGAQSKYLYTGKEQDTETGLYYYGARYYDPSIMKFTQADTEIPNLYDPQSLNRYSYVKNNPIKYVDPSGHQEVEAVMGMTIVITSAVVLGAAMIMSTFYASHIAATASNGPPKDVKSQQAAQAALGAADAYQTSSNLLDLTKSAAEATGGQKSWSEFGQDVCYTMASPPIFVGVQGSKFSRFMSKAEKEAVEESGMLRGGKPGPTYFTPDKYQTSSSAQQKLSLKKEPEFRADFTITNNPKTYGPTEVPPKYGQPGGGDQLRSNEQVCVNVYRWTPLRK